MTHEQTLAALRADYRQVGSPPPDRVDKRLLVTVWNSLTTQTLRLRLRLRSGSGLDLVEYVITPTADRLPSTVSIPCREDQLASVLLVTNTPTQRGQTFARFALSHRVDQQDLTTMILAQDYVTPGAPLGWPGGRIASPTEGPGAIRRITGTDPAMGAEALETVPTNARWRFIAWQSGVITSATPATRIPRLLVDDGVVEIFFVGVDVTVGESSEFYWQWVAGKARGAASGGRPTQEFPLDLVLPAGYRLRTDTLGRQASDDLTAPRILVEEWIDV